MHVPGTRLATAAAMKLIRWIRSRIFALIAASTAATACSGGNQPTPVEPDPLTGIARRGPEVAQAMPPIERASGEPVGEDARSGIDGGIRDGGTADAGVRDGGTTDAGTVGGARDGGVPQPPGTPVPGPGSAPIPRPEPAPSPPIPRPPAS